MYKPNFCADCGTRIARVRWRIWTSRRFCDACARRWRKSGILFPVIASLMLFSIGLIAGRSARPSPPPLTIERGQMAPLPQETNTKAEKNNAPATSNSASSYGADGTDAERPTDPNEVVSICGARTQKGAPCSRRVRGTGRCWQHKGKPAMLPPEKLTVQG